MGKLTNVLDGQDTAQQLSIDDYMALGDPEPNPNGICPFVVQCNKRRQRLSTYRQYQACHWRAFRNVGGCPIFQNGGKDDVT